MNLVDTLKTGTPEEIQRQRINTEKDKLDARRQAQRELAEESRGPVPTILSYRADELPGVTFPPKRPILKRSGQVFFAAGEIWEIFSMRSVGKTWMLMTLALGISNGKSVMGFVAPERRRVLYIDWHVKTSKIATPSCALEPV